MGKGLEALLSVIWPHAGISNTAKGQVRGGNVDDGVVYTTSAVDTALKKEFFQFFIFCKKVKC